MAAENQNKSAAGSAEASTVMGAEQGKLSASNSRRLQPMGNIVIQMKIDTDAEGAWFLVFLALLIALAVLVPSCDRQNDMQKTIHELT